MIYNEFGYVSDVKDVVNAVLYLLSDKADMTTGAVFPVDGGMQLM